MSEERTITLELSQAEARVLLELCSHELIAAVHHRIVAPGLPELTQKICDALAPEGKEDTKEHVPG